MGLAKRFIDQTTKEHIPHRTDKSLTGTARYASLNAHLGHELSRRDDLEAIGYVLIYFYTGCLPWQNVKCDSDDKMYKQIKDVKQTMTVSDLCAECPLEFEYYMEYCRSMQFEESPDYLYLKNLFSNLAHREGIDLFDNVYDWGVRATTIKQFPTFYDFIENLDISPMNDQGKFRDSLVRTK